jgi:hypothetical protein
MEERGLTVYCGRNSKGIEWRMGTRETGIKGLKNLEVVVSGGKWWRSVKENLVWKLMEEVVENWFEPFE